MLRYRSLSFLILCLAFMQVGCASLQQKKWLSAHKKNLTQISGSTLSGEAKLDGMLADYVQFLKEDLKFVDPRKGVKFVKKYHDQNGAAMEKILKDTEKWQGSLNVVDKLSLGSRLIKKPYIKDLVDLGPKFRKKYKQYEFATKLAAKMGGSLTGLIGKELGL